jgi:hypothetical protein
MVRDSAAIGKPRSRQQARRQGKNTALKFQDDARPDIGLSRHRAMIGLRSGLEEEGFARSLEAKSAGYSIRRRQRSTTGVLRGQR